MKLGVALLVVILILPIISADLFPTPTDVVSVGLGNGVRQTGVNVFIPDEIFNSSASTSNSTRFWVTNSLGTLDDANTAQFDNLGGTLTIDESHFDLLYCQLTGCTMAGDIDMNNNDILNANNISANNIFIGGVSTDDLYINSAGDSFDQQILQFNFTFSNLSLPTLQNFNGMLLKNLNDSSSNFLAVQNDQDISANLFTSGSNFQVGLDLNSSAGVAVSGTDLLLTTTTENKSIIMRLINSTGGLTDTLIIQSDGNVLLQGELHFKDRNKSIFSEVVDGGFGMVFAATEVLTGGETPFVWRAKNSSGGDIFPLILQNGLNNSGGHWRNSGIFGGDTGLTNLTELTNCFTMANAWGMQIRVACDTTDTGSDIIIQDSIQSGGIVFADGGIRAETIVDFVMNGEDVNIQDGGLHISTAVTFEKGVVAGDEITTFIEDFNSGLGSFTNLQSDLGNWFPTANILCSDGDCANALGISGVGDIIMEANISTVNINSTSLNFIYSLVNILGSNDFEVTVNNNVGSGEVSIFTDSTNNVVLSSQSIALPSSMSDQPKVSIRFNCDVTNANRDCFVDTISVNGTAIATTLTNVSGFDSVIKFSDGVLAADGFPERGIIYNASGDITIIRGNVTFENIIEQNLIITNSTTLNGTTIGDWGDIPDFLKLDGSTPMQAISDFGGFNIINISNVDTDTITSGLPVVFENVNGNGWTFSIVTLGPITVALLQGVSDEGVLNMGFIESGLEIVDDGDGISVLNFIDRSLVQQFSHTYNSTKKEMIIGGTVGNFIIYDGNIENITFEQNIFSDSNINTTGNSTAAFLFGNGSQLTGIIHTGNPFDQSLNTTDDVIFKSWTANPSSDTSITTSEFTGFGLLIPEIGFTGEGGLNAGSLRDFLFIRGANQDPRLLLSDSSVTAFGIIDYIRSTDVLDLNNFARYDFDNDIQVDTGSVIIKRDNEKLCLGASGCTDFGMKFTGTNVQFDIAGSGVFDFNNASGGARILAGEFLVGTPSDLSYSANDKYIDSLPSPENLRDEKGKIKRGVLGDAQFTITLDDLGNCWEQPQGIYEWCYDVIAFPENGIRCYNEKIDLKNSDFNNHFNERQEEIIETECATKQKDVTGLSEHAYRNTGMISETIEMYDLMFADICKEQNVVYNKYNWCNAIVPEL